jgi:hypothetical protein
MRRTLYLLLLAGGIAAAGSSPATLALFTASTSVAANVFSTGTVILSAAPASAVVTYTTMAPGDSSTASLVLSSSGSMALRYAISGGATNADSKALRAQLLVTIRTIDVTTPGTPCDNFDGTQLYSGNLSTTAALVGDPATGSQTGDRTLSAGASETLCFRGSLPSAAPDSVQAATTTATFTFDAEQTANN